MWPSWPGVAMVLTPSDAAQGPAVLQAPSQDPQMHAGLHPRPFPPGGGERRENSLCAGDLEDLTTPGRNSGRKCANRVALWEEVGYVRRSEPGWRGSSHSSTPAR